MHIGLNQSIIKAGDALIMIFFWITLQLLTSPSYVAGQRLYHVIQQRDKTITELVRYKWLVQAIHLLLEFVQRVDDLFDYTTIFISKNE